MTRLLKVSMSDSMYDEFVQDAKDSYDNCYWLKISADSKIYKGIAGAVLEQKDVIQSIEDIRQELIVMVNQKYKEDVASLKRELNKLKGR